MQKIAQDIGVDKAKVSDLRKRFLAQIGGSIDFADLEAALDSPEELQKLFSGLMPLSLREIKRRVPPKGDDPPVVVEKDPALGFWPNWESKKFWEDWRDELARRKLAKRPIFGDEER